MQARPERAVTALQAELGARRQLVPHWGQAAAELVPHSRQNFARSGLSCRQAGQIMNRGGDDRRRAPDRDFAHRKPLARAILRISSTQGWP